MSDDNQFKRRRHRIKQRDIGKIKTSRNIFRLGVFFRQRRKTLLKQLGVKTLEPFECADKKLAISAGGALVEYMLQTGNAICRT